MLRHPVVRRGVAATDSPGEDLADRGGGQPARGVRSRAAPTAPPWSIGARLAGPDRSGASRAVGPTARRRPPPPAGSPTLRPTRPRRSTTPRRPVGPRPSTRPPHAPPASARYARPTPP